MVDRRELTERIARVLGILERPRAPEGAPAVNWAHERAERAANVARALPERARRVVARVTRQEEDRVR